jgi:hypothetical protein
MTPVPFLPAKVSALQAQRLLSFAIALLAPSDQIFF